MQLNKQTLFIFIILTGLVLGAFQFNPVLAAEEGDIYDTIQNNYDDIEKGVTGKNEDGTFGETTIFIKNLIQVVLGFLGIIFVILIIWSGFQWMTAGGNSDAIKKARDRMINAVIGLVIVLAAYSIALFIIEMVADSTQRQF